MVKRWMKRTGLGLMAGVMSLPVGVQAEETSYSMEPEKVYEIDLNGDGKQEEVFYKTVSAQDEESPERAVLEIYVDGELLYEMRGEDWTYGWRMSQCPMEDAKQYLFAYSTSENDWTDQAFLMSRDDEDTLSLKGELCELTRENRQTLEETTEAEVESREEPFLTGWARVSTEPVRNQGKDSVTVYWADTIKITGILEIPIEYRITEEGLQAEPAPYALDGEKEWTAAIDFSTVKEPGQEGKGMEVKKGEKIKLLSVTKVNQVFYLEGEKENGDRGWIRDTDQVEYREEDGTYGYFEESVFAG